MSLFINEINRKMNKNLTINNKRGFKPLFVYEDILMNKSIILNDNKNKSGIYR
jgi:hypothetical protein